MNETLQAIVLALLQGLTEFLPISSSAHLVIPSLVFGWPDQGLAFDVAVHLGTLLAVVIYYRRDLITMSLACLGASGGEQARAQRRLVGQLALATLPAVILGLAGSDFIESQLRNLPVIATTTLVFGLLLGLADRRHGRAAQVSWGSALLIGLAQAMALVPGVSRSGVTITAALLLGLSRQEAARFSFLLSIPIIAGAGLLKGLDLAAQAAPVDWAGLAMATLVAGITAYACIGVFLRLLDRIGMMPFVVYRVLLALVLYAIWVV
ncbi:MAG: undecaprenyl-diphosphate phosphatase [Parahaliea sp.]